MTGPAARDPLPGEPEHRDRWPDAARPELAPEWRDVRQLRTALTINARAEGPVSAAAALEMLDRASQLPSRPAASTGKGLGYRKGFDDGVQYARDIDRTIARMASREDVDTAPTAVSFPLPAVDHDIDDEDEHGNETSSPGWEITAIPGGVVVPTVEGIAIEGELHDDVGRLEEAAQKLLAAVAWHEWFARSAAAPSVPPQPTVPRAPGCSDLSFEENEPCGECPGCRAADAAEGLSDAPAAATVPRAPVEALLAAIRNAEVVGPDVYAAAVEVQRHLDTTTTKQPKEKS